MTYNEILAAARSLSLNEQGRLMDDLRREVKFNNMNLRAGAKVCFTNSKTGAIIQGVFVRMKQKYAEVHSQQNKHGLDSMITVRWSVPPEMLRMVQ